MTKQVVFSHQLSKNYDEQPEPRASVYQNDDFTLTVLVSRRPRAGEPRADLPWYTTDEFITLTGEQWKNLCALLTDDPDELLVKNWKKRLTDEQLALKQQYPFGPT